MQRERETNEDVGDGTRLADGPEDELEEVGEGEDERHLDDDRHQWVEGLLTA